MLVCLDCPRPTFVLSAYTQERLLLPSADLELAAKIYPRPRHRFSNIERARLHRVHDLNRRLLLQPLDPSAIRI